MKKIIYTIVICLLLIACNTHHKGYNSNGVLIADTLFINDSIAELTKFDEEGNVIEESILLNGLLNGVQKMYYPTGDVKSEIDFLKGKENGNWKIWYSNGFVHLKGKSKNGKYIKVEEFYDNVSLAYQINYLR